jgi:hypothetical protein
MQGSGEQRLDYRLAAYIEPRGALVEFPQHSLSELNRCAVI